MKKSAMWHTDADNVEPSIIEEIIFKNNVINEFLSVENKHFVVATKGVGKTLLLKYKRFLLFNKYMKNDKNKGIIFIPADKPYLDFVTDFGSISQDRHVIMENHSISRKIWAISIMISLLSFYHNITKSDLSIYSYELSELENRHNQRYKHYIDWCRGIRPVNPCFVAGDILSMSGSNIQCFLDGYRFMIEDLFKSIHSGIFLFIDRVDQALKDYGKNVWISFQAGLIEAAWDLMRINNHIKIYTSIRQEAFLSYSSPDKQAITGNISIMRYDHKDLKSIVNRNCKYYEGRENIYSFLGFYKIENAFAKVLEDSYKYIQRHTLGRPRDLVVICSKLSPYRDSLIPKTFRTIVNETAHVDIAKNIFDEISFLFHSLIDKEKQEEFLALIPQNVLNNKQIIDICRKQNYQVNCDGTNCKKCLGQHVFCDLYNAGLLGIIKQERTQEKQHVQKFVGPYEFRSFDKGSLPPTFKYYLIHPCLQAYIEDIRGKKYGYTYDLVDHVVVGHNYPWTEELDYFTDIFNIKKEIKNQIIVDAISKLTTEIVSKKIDHAKINEEISYIGNLIEKTEKWSDKAFKVIDIIQKLAIFVG